MIIKDKKLKKKLDKIPDSDKKGAPIYKIAVVVQKAPIKKDKKSK